MHNPILDSWVHRLFQRFDSIYGSQKTAAMWGDLNLDGIVTEWARALGRYDRAVLVAAIDAVPEHYPDWPPTLGQFLSLCAAASHRPGRMAALPVPARTAEEIAKGAEQIARVKAMLRPVVAKVTKAPESTLDCTCWRGLERSEELCPACAKFAAGRMMMSRMMANMASEVEK